MTNKELLKSNKLLKEQIELLIEKQKLEFKEPTIDKEPEFEVGKWYKNESCIATFFVKSLSPRKAYGITNRGTWKDENNFQFIGGFNNHKEATKEEVEEALIKEAKKRGFDKGVSFIPTHLENKNKAVTRISKLDGFRYKDGLLYAYHNVQGAERAFDSYTTGSGYNWHIFRDGKWADIIEEKSFEIAGHEVKYDKSHGMVEIGLFLLSY